MHRRNAVLALFATGNPPVPVRVPQAQRVICAWRRPRSVSAQPPALPFGHDHFRRSRRTPTGLLPERGPPAKGCVGECLHRSGGLSSCIRAVRWRSRRVLRAYRSRPQCRRAHPQPSAGRSGHQGRPRTPGRARMPGAGRSVLRLNRALRVPAGVRHCHFSVGYQCGVQMHRCAETALYKGLREGGTRRPRSQVHAKCLVPALPGQEREGREWPDTSGRIAWECPRRRHSC